jgi:hypothetical protein
MKRGLFFCVLLLAVVAMPVLADRPIDRIPAGLDYWQTLGSGATMYDFSSSPLPAGFFCNGSAPFKGRVNFEGVPLHTQPEGILGTTDTVIERLDDAIFDDSGTAQTRIRARALSLRGTDILKTSCGRFKVTANLPANQPVGPMIFHSVDKMGGTFDAQLRLRVRMTFTNVATSKKFSVDRDVYLPTVRNTPFAVGKAAIACQQVDQAALAGSNITLEDGKPLSSRPAIDKTVTVGGISAEPAQPVYVVTGCYCQNGVCLRTYSWHDPCAGETYDKCEKHWTYTPCQLNYTSQCTTSATQQNYLEQLKELHDRGFINESPETVLRKQLRSASQIEKDQAAREREQVNQQ